MKLDRVDARILHGAADRRPPHRRGAGRARRPDGHAVRPARAQLEQAGVILGYAAILDPARLGLNVQAFVQVKLERHTDENVEQFQRELAALDRS